MKISRSLFALFASLTVFAVLASNSSIAKASASNIYIAQAAAGSKNGADCADAYASSYFNSSSNWGSGSTQIGPGSTVHLCGTFTGTKGQTLLTFQGSGSSGSPITLLFESGAVLTAPYWGGTSDGAIDVNGVSYITVNGGTNGIIQDTGNGTGLGNEAASVGIEVNGSNYVTIQSLTLSDICLHTSTSDLGGCDTGGVGDEAINVASSSNVTITRNTIHDTSAGVFETPGSSDSNLTITNNTISRINWGIGGFNGGSLSGVTITGNDISCVAGSATCNWDTTDDANFHHNGVIVYPQSGKISGMVIANNYIHDINGQYNGINEETAHIFFDPGGSGVVASPQIYNNIFATTTGSGPSNAFVSGGIDIGYNGGVTGAIIVNNTMSGDAGWAFGSDTKATIENNIAVGMYQVEYFDSGASGNTVNYNDGYGTDNGWVSIGSLVQWLLGSLSICSGGCDKNSISTNPELNSSYMLSSGSPATGAGTNLTSLGITGLANGAPQTFGVNYACGSGCVSRPATGNWDIGAYPAGSSSLQSAPPTGVKGIAVPLS